MSVSLIISIIIMSALVLLISSCGAKSVKETSINANQVTPAQVTSGKVSSMSKAELDKMLAKIDKADAPKPKMGAMCYEPVRPPKSIDYVCPACGEKTIYTKQTWFVDRELKNCRRIYDQIKKEAKLNIKLDESEFCKKCSPSIAKPQLKLIVTLDDGTKHVTSPVNSNDLLMLRDFLKGKLTYTNATDAVLPLKKSSQRLRQLLGLDKNKK